MFVWIAGEKTLELSLILDYTTWGLCDDNVTIRKPG